MLTNPTILWVTEMRVVRVDERGRIILPKRLRERLPVKPGHNLIASFSNGTIVLQKLKPASDKDSLLWDVQHPLHVNKRTLKKIDLDKIEDEMWLP
jgi:AbrB family looped-hinge helix DNA binding protein